MLKDLMNRLLHSASHSRKKHHSSSGKGHYYKRHSSSSRKRPLHRHSSSDARYGHGRRGHDYYKDRRRSFSSS
ncbi:hypothetical protein Q5741_09985 [Paenibacillus sp. JX-17]|uniref:Uncharacterized protein n=1 Tax=Paenibacillus lacisoli TaxID=3064525 RepID=A0ABT9CBW2_9BACL|nr:hypothetical protein [Paenibacillus sp. JX-17]MDO7906752.1 hypothetical protein [Paenibacillus sp. JX-17]